MAKITRKMLSKQSNQFDTLHLTLDFLKVVRLVFWSGRTIALHTHSRRATRSKAQLVSKSTSNTCSNCVLSGFRCKCFLPNSVFLSLRKVERG